ncbi:hypothetical protein FOCC_FOCC016478 [Frankliniella occidentalis]|nr:hypothetical protein FOCC_FOCC016478 [Frankliniella occidentalis]
MPHFFRCTAFMAHGTSSPLFWSLVVAASSISRLLSPLLQRLRFQLQNILWVFKECEALPLSVLIQSVNKNDHCMLSNVEYALARLQAIICTMVPTVPGRVSAPIFVPSSAIPTR